MLFIGLQAAVAAQQASSSSAAASSEAGAYIDGGTWTYPTLEQVIATSFNLGSNVVIDCGVAKTGHMTDCYVAEADGSPVKPRDKNVGVAYLAYAVVDPASIGGVQPGDRVQFHYNWTDLFHSSLQDAKKLPMASADQMARYKTSKWKIPSQMSKFDTMMLKSEYKSGAAMVDCLIAPDGTMQACTVLAEYPEGNGMGAMTAKGFQKYTSVDPATVIGGIQPGDHRTFKLNFGSVE